MAQHLDENLLNASVHNFYQHNVKLEKKETKVYEHLTFPIVDRIMSYVNDHDPRFLIDPLKVGSYWHGLKVEKADEFDYSIVLDGPYKCCLETEGSRFYHHNQTIGIINKIPWSTDVVHSFEALPYPAPAYYFVKYRSGTWTQYADLVRDGDIVPYLVTKRLRKLIKLAIQELDIKGDVHPCRKTHGPALTIHLAMDCRNVDIDLAPMIRLQMPFDYFSIEWPHKDTLWPSEDTKRKIQEMGVSLVAKKDFYWMVSFAEVEGELVEDLSENRKMVLKVMKKLNTDYWGHNSDPEVSSYILKNIWFWEMEEYPDDSSWDYGSLWDRLVSMINTLLQTSKQRSLKQFFHPEINLMLEKDPEELTVAKERIHRFLRDPLMYLNVKNDHEERCFQEERCDKCGDDDHFTTECPFQKRQQCPICHKLGHRSKFCQFLCAECGSTTSCVNHAGDAIDSLKAKSPMEIPNIENWLLK